jgi:hypothetical protein
MACDGRFFDHAHLGMLVECIPTDSGWGPEGSETYSPPIFRAVLAEDVPGSIWFGGRNVPTVAAVSAAYNVMQRWAVGGAGNNAVAVVMSLWDLAKVPSVPIRDPDLDVALGNIERVCAVLALDYDAHVRNPYQVSIRGANAVATVRTMANPWAIFAGETDNVDAYLLGSPRAPSIAMHILDNYRENMHYYFDAASPVYLRTTKNSGQRAAFPQYNKATGPGEEVTIFGGVVTRQYNMGTMTHAEFVALEAVAVAQGDTIGASITDINRLRDAAFGEIEDWTGADMEHLFPGMADLHADDKVVLEAAAAALAARMKVPAAMLHMQEHFPVGNTPFFMEHEHHAHMLRDAAGIVDAEFMDVEYGADGSGTFHSVSLGAAMGGYTTVERRFQRYDKANHHNMDDPIVNNVAELTRVRRKRGRDPDMTNHVAFRDVEFNEVMTQLDRLPPMRRWIVGEFIQREGVGDDANCIRICLRKPFVL